jgi:signal peptidase II
MTRRLTVFLIALTVFGLDRWSKYLVETNVGPFDTKVIVPGLLNIVSSRNAGVAFGILSESASAYRTSVLVAVSLLAIGVLAALLWRVERTDLRSALGLACIFGGALGNVFDRVRSGSVTDFLDFYVGQTHWYVFNLADTAICIGAGLLLLSMWKKPSGVPARAS